MVVKKGITVLLGYGVIESDYSYDAIAVQTCDTYAGSGGKKTGQWQLPEERHVVHEDPH